MRWRLETEPPCARGTGFEIVRPEIVFLHLPFVPLDLGGSAPIKNFWQSNRDGERWLYRAVTRRQFFRFGIFFRGGQRNGLSHDGYERRHHDQLRRSCAGSGDGLARKLHQAPFQPRLLVWMYEYQLHERQPNGLPRDDRRGHHLLFFPERLCGPRPALVGHFRHRHHALQWKRVGHRPPARAHAGHELGDLVVVRGCDIRQQPRGFIRPLQ